MINHYRINQWLSTITLWLTIFNIDWMANCNHPTMQDIHQAFKWCIPGRNHDGSTIINHWLVVITPSQHIGKNCVKPPTGPASLLSPGPYLSVFGRHRGRVATSRRTSWASSDPGARKLESPRDGGGRNVMLNQVLRCCWGGAGCLIMLNQKYFGGYRFWGSCSRDIKGLCANEPVVWLHDDWSMNWSAGRICRILDCG